MIKLTKIRLKCGYENYTELIPHRILFINRNLSICHLESIDYFQSDSSCGEAKGIGIHNSWFPRGGCGLCLPVFMSVCLSVCLSVYASLFLTLFCRLLAGAWRPRAGPQPQGQPPRLTLTQSSYSQTRPEWPDAHRLAYGHMALALLCCTVLENYIHDDQCE